MLQQQIEEQKLKEQRQQSAQTSINERERSYSDLNYDGRILFHIYLLSVICVVFT